MYGDLISESFLLSRSLATQVQEVEIKETCENTNVVCGHCGMAYNDMDSMFMHLTEEHIDGETAERQILQYECDVCRQTFKKKSILRWHLKEHMEVEISLSGELEIINRAKLVIDNRITYKCEVCKKVMLSKRGFLRHIRIHMGSRPCTCTFCGKTYRIDQDLARHIKDVHQRLKRYSCDICNRAFANKSTKDDHRRIHTGERPYTCEICSKSFRTLNLIYVHNRTHTNYKPHKCSYCGKCFMNRQRLNNHKTTHTGIKAFSCDICGKLFSVKGEVARHRTTHNHDKPFSCSSCGLKFGQRRYLRNHIKQHHSEQSDSMLQELDAILKEFGRS